MGMRYGFDEARIAGFWKEGRGKGFGANYKPWLTVHDVPSRGRSQRLLGMVTGRVHHLLSDLERGAFLIYDFRDDVRDIREQFPLDRDETRSIAEAAGIRHPIDASSRAPLVQTTDLVIDLDRGGKTTTIARTIKPSSELAKARTIEKLEIERRYWSVRGVDWGIVTERELPSALLRNLELLQACASLDDLKQPYEGYYRERAGLIATELERWPRATLREFCQGMATRLGLEPDGTLLLIRHLLACKIWNVDLMEPIVETMPISAFRRSDMNAVRRAQR